MGNMLEAVAIGGLGTTELLIILGILVFIFGASKLPELGRSLGSGIRGFQKSMKDEEPPKQLESEKVEETEADASSTQKDAAATKSST